MDTVRDWGMGRYRRFNQRRADAEAFFARSCQEVMRDLVVAPQELAQTTVGSECLAPNVVRLDAHRRVARHTTGNRNFR